MKKLLSLIACVTAFAFIAPVFAQERAIRPRRRKKAKKAAEGRGEEAQEAGQEGRQEGQEGRGLELARPVPASSLLPKVPRCR